jgi:hypothetical protein
MFSYGPILHNFFPWLMLISDAVSSVQIHQLTQMYWSVYFLIVMHVAFNVSFLIFLWLIQLLPYRILVFPWISLVSTPSDLKNLVIDFYFVSMLNVLQYYHYSKHCKATQFKWGKVHVVISAIFLNARNVTSWVDLKMSLLFDFPLYFEMTFNSTKSVEACSL